jgi:hypothetical protein
MGRMPEAANATRSAIVAALLALEYEREIILIGPHYMGK